MKKHLVKITCLVAATVLFLASCKKTTTDTPAEDQTQQVEKVKQALETNLAFINSFTTGVNNKDKAKTNGSGGAANTSPNGTASCPNFNLAFDTTGGFGVLLAYDYGNGCPADIALGIIRTGKITYKYFISNNLAAAIGVKYQNYLDGGTTYNGIFNSAYQYTALGSNYFLGADSLRISNVLLGNSVYQTALYYKQQQGAATPFIYTDDVYHITGSTSIVNSTTGLTKFEALTPLVNKLDCAYIVAGRVKITLGATAAIVDFGNGNCDNQGTIEINGTIIPISF
jgi:hypothetical protein